MSTFRGLLVYRNLIFILFTDILRSLLICVGECIWHVCFLSVNVRSGFIKWIGGLGLLLSGGALA